MYHEIIEDFTHRNVNFKAGRIVVEGDFPAAEFEGWILLGKVKRHEGQHHLQPERKAKTPEPLAPEPTKPAK